MIPKGAVFANGEEGYGGQITAGYKIEGIELIERTKLWLISVKKDCIFLILKLRCLNEGFSLSNTTPLVPSGLTLNPETDLSSQKAIWDSIKAHSKVYKFDAVGQGENSNCKEALKQAAKNLLDSINLTPESIEIIATKGLLECNSLEDVLIKAYTKLGIPIVIKNLKGTPFTNGTLSITGDVYMEPKHYALFVK